MDVSPSDIELNAHTVAGFELRATVCLASDRPGLAAGYLQLAADVASRNHPGWFASPPLEEMIQQLAGYLPVPDRGGDPDGHITHVLAGEAGTLIHDARNWWRLDPEARLVALPDGQDGPLGGAAELRQQCVGSSLVVLHGDGAALAPLIALAGWPEGPPVVMVEPAHLSFWAGTGVVRAVLHHSDTGAALAAERRCQAPGRGVLVDQRDLQFPDRLLQLLVSVRARVAAWGAPEVPSAVLPAQPSLVDLRVLQRQIHDEVADGVPGALRRWRLPREITNRPAWVLLARQPARALRLIRSLLEQDQEVAPDLVLVDIDGSGLFNPLIGDLAGIVELIEPDRSLTVDEATYLAVRRLASDQILITTDGVEPTGEVIRSLECELESGAGAVHLAALPDGEWLEVRLNPRHVGWPRPIPLGPPTFSSLPSRGVRGV